MFCTYLLEAGSANETAIKVVQSLFLDEFVSVSVCMRMCVCVCADLL